MTRLVLIAAAALAPLTLAACGPKTQGPRTALDCPAQQGELTRKSASATSCTYVAANGANVTLQLTPVSGSVDQTLDGLEKTLMAQVEAAAPATPAPPAAPSTPDEAAKTAETAAADAADSSKAKGDGVNVRLGPHGVEVEETGGSKTKVNLPGIHIEADEGKDSAKVQIGPIHVDANDDAAVVRIRRDVRLRGEALSRQQRGVRATFISQSKDATGAKHVVGYEAGGPKAGPITVAVIQGADKFDSGDGFYNDVKKLVRENGGV